MILPYYIIIILYKDMKDIFTDNNFSGGSGNDGQTLVIRKVIKRIRNR